MYNEGSHKQGITLERTNIGQEGRGTRLKWTIRLWRSEETLGESPSLYQANNSRVFL